MSNLLSDADICYLRSLFPLLDIKPLTAQQEQLVLLTLRGVSVAEASRQAGYDQPQYALLKDERVVAVKDFLREKTLGDLRVDVQTLTAMLFEAHRKSATATEEVMAIRELGKLHDLYPQASKQSGTTINQVNTINVTNEKQLARMSDSELLNLVNQQGGDLAALLEPPTPIAEAACEEIPDE